MSSITSAQSSTIRRDPIEPVYKGSVAIYVHHIIMGGLDLVMLRLGDFFARQGCKVWLVMLNQEGSQLEIIPPTVEVVNLNVPSTLRALLPLRRFLIDHRPDVVLTAMPLNNLAAILASRLAGSRTRVVGSEHIELDPKFLGHNRSQQIVLPYVLPFLYNRADAMVAVSDIIKRQLVEFGVRPDVIRVLRNPALTPDFETAMQQPVDHPWFRDRSIPIIIGVGRLDFRKDWAKLIRAFALLRQKRPVRLVLVGEGDQEAPLRKVIAELGVEDDVWLAGLRRDPLALVSKSSVFVLCSLDEGSPLVIVEALACGCPVVATRTAGATDLLDGGRLGRLVPLTDEQALADAIDATLSESHDPEPGRRRAAEFTVERSGGAYLSLFRELCTKK
jgi:glycosyltransferase involved in cell wall biosynthesis